MDSRQGSYDDLSNLSESRMDSSQLAKLAVEQVGPHNYKITGRSNKPLRFLIAGCHGTGNEHQEDVAALMETIASRPNELAPEFILFLGDNGYDYGFNTPTHPGFNDCFHNIYGNPKFKAISKMICLMDIGNHDGNYHAKYLAAARTNPQGEKTEINQAAHTYLNHTEAKVNLFSQDTLDIRDLQGYANVGDQWVMPYFYEGYDLGDLQLFCINSNSLAKQYLQSQKAGTPFGQINQFIWFKKQFDEAKAAGKKIIIAGHHPLYTCGKRAFPEKYDATHYLTTQEIEQLKEVLGIQSSSYQAILTAIFAKEGIFKRKTESNIFFYFCAHDHYLSYFDNSEDPNFTFNLRQFTSGGGGGTLDLRTTCDEHPYVFHMKKYGVGLFTYDPTNPDGYTLDIFAREGHDYLHVRFDEKSHHLPVLSANIDTKVDFLTLAVLDACNRYLADIRKEEDTLQRKTPINNEYGSGWAGLVSWGLFQAKEYVMPDKDKKTRKEKILTIDNIKAYFSQYKAPSFDKLVSQLYQLIMHMNKLDGQQFYRLLDKEVKETLNTDLESLFKNAKREEEKLPYYFKMSPTT